MKIDNQASDSRDILNLGSLQKGRRFEIAEVARYLDASKPNIDVILKFGGKPLTVSLSVDINGYFNQHNALGQKTYKIWTGNGGSYIDFDEVFSYGTEVFKSEFYLSSVVESGNDLILSFKFTGRTHAYIDIKGLSYTEDSPLVSHEVRVY